MNTGKKSSQSHLQAKAKYREKNKVILAQKASAYYLANKAEINRKRRARYAAKKKTSAKN